MRQGWSQVTSSVCRFLARGGSSSFAPTTWWLGSRACSTKTSTRTTTWIGCGASGRSRVPSARRRLHEACVVGEHDRLHAVAEVELAEDARDVRLHRRLADDELLGDLRIREAARDQAQDLELARGEALQRRRGLLVGQRAGEAV